MGIWIRLSYLNFGMMDKVVNNFHSHSCFHNLLNPVYFWSPVLKFENVDWQWMGEEIYLWWCIRVIPFNSLTPMGWCCNLKLIKDSYLVLFLWNCLQVNATRSHWWVVSIGSGNGLVPSGNKPLPEPMNVDPDLWHQSHHMMSLDHNQLTLGGFEPYIHKISLVTTIGKEQTSAYLIAELRTVCPWNVTHIKKVCFQNFLYCGMPNKEKMTLMGGNILFIVISYF